MTSQNKSLSLARSDFLARTVVVIPALNEAPCVAETVVNWLQLGAGLVRVVDNGSTDATSAIAQLAGADVRNEPQRGYGAAAWTGTRELPSQFEWILFSSADGSDRLEDKPAFQDAIDRGALLVLGERVTRASSRRRLTPTQRFGNALCCRLIAIGWGHRFRDMASLRMIRRDAFERLSLQDRAFGWNVEMQVRALELGLPVAEIPVEVYPRTAGESKISGSFIGIIRAGWGILSMVGKLYAGRGARSAPSSLAIAQSEAGASRIFGR